MIQKTHCKPMEIMEMDYYMFLALRKEFIIQDIKSTEEGRKALADAERYNRKNADVSKVRAMFGK